MTNNDVMRSLRFMLKINNPKIAEICKLAGLDVPVVEIDRFSKNEEDPQYLECSDQIMAHFLNGLVIWKRGKDETRPLAPLEIPVSNNTVLKKLKVAFQLQEEDLIAIMSGTGLPFGKAELSAFLRKKGHRNYRECGDQVLRNFLKGLTARLHQVPTSSFLTIRI
jgi:uncharacterized protein YehS (DUF1456 family)